MIIVIRFGSQLPVVGVNRDYFSQWFSQQSNDAFSFFSAFTGGSFERMSIFALSITPYITSSIIIQLLTIAIPALEEMHKDGEEGRKKINKITRYVTVALALIESLAMTIGFGNSGLIPDMNFLKGFTVVVALTAGSTLLMWIGERITENGVGNGISIVLMVNILSSIPSDMANLYEMFISGKTIGILSETKETEAAENREQGFREKLEDSGAEISWSVSGSFGQDGDQSLSAMPKVDVIAALDDNSLTEAGKNGAANDLHGALVYGIGHSTEAFYYLDVTAVECLVVPDEFNMGYQSLTQIAERLRNRFYRPEDQTISYTVIRKETMFTKENQEILFTMS